MRRKLFILYTIFSAFSMFASVSLVSAFVVELRFHDIMIVDGNGRPRGLTPSEDRQRKLNPLLGAIAFATPPFLWAYLIALRLRDWTVRRYRMKSELCTGCGYSLTGNTSGVCPECGAVAGKVG